MSMTYHFPAELEAKLRATRADDANRPDHVEPPASGFMHEGRLNMGPAILLASALSLGCWAVIISLGLRLFR